MVRQPCIDFRQPSAIQQRLGVAPIRWTAEPCTVQPGPEATGRPLLLSLPGPPGGSVFVSLLDQFSMSPDRLPWQQFTADDLQSLAVVVPANRPKPQHRAAISQPPGA